MLEGIMTYGRRYKKDKRAIGPHREKLLLYFTKSLAGSAKIPAHVDFDCSYRRGITYFTVVFYGKSFEHIGKQLRRNKRLLLAGSLAGHGRGGKFFGEFYQRVPNVLIQFRGRDR